MSHDLQAASQRAYRLTKHGLEFPRELTPAAFEHAGRVLGRIANATPFAIGDLLWEATSISELGDRYRLAEQLTHLSYERLRECERVSASFRHDQRDLVPWAYYKAALALPADERIEALTAARDGAVPLSRFVVQIRERRRRTHQPPPSPAIARESVVAQCPQCACVFDVPVHQERAG